MLEDVAKADVVCSMTENGCEAQVLRSAHIEAPFVPHAVPFFDSSYRFRESMGLNKDQPCFVHVGNLWPVKNHLGLLAQMKKFEGDWRLCLFGNPVFGHAEYCRSVRKAVSQDPRVILLEGQSREVLMAGVKEAHALLLTSNAEGCPLSILEAMSQGTPWVATPECGSVHYQAGGVVVKLEQFPSVLMALLADPRLRAKIGALGKAHWSACFNIDKMASIFESIINEKPLPDLRFPKNMQIQSVKNCVDVLSLAEKMYANAIK